MTQTKAARPGVLLREVRRLLGINQVELAEEIGVARATIGRWEGGLATPRAAETTRLLEAVTRRNPALGARLSSALGVAAASNPSAEPLPSASELHIDALDASVYVAADALSVPSAALRPVLARWLLHLAAAGISLEQARVRLAVAR